MTDTAVNAPSPDSTAPKTESKRLALVTGASRGLGRAVALRLGRAGWHVVALARTMGALEELDDAIQGEGGSCTIAPLDLTDDAGVARMAAALMERWGRLDLWVHCAAYADQLTPANHIEVKDWDKTFAVNAAATQRLIVALDPLLMAAPAGRVVYAADTDKADQPFWGPYAASKRAGESLMRSYAAERRTRVTIEIVTPPPMPTALRARFWPGEDPKSLGSCDAGAAKMLGRLDA